MVLSSRAVIRSRVAICSISSGRLSVESREGGSLSGELLALGPFTPVTYIINESINKRCVCVLEMRNPRGNANNNLPTSDKRVWEEGESCARHAVCAVCASALAVLNIF